MRIFYDTEFLEDGHTIELISIGMVREDGAEYYAIDELCNWWMVTHHQWLREHVLPSLPVVWDGAKVEFDEQHPDYLALKARQQIADEVREFILATSDPQLWAWYAATDFVALYQLFGRLVDAPEGFPRFTNDLKQECVRLGNPRMPAQEGGKHNALADARHVKAMAVYLDELR